MTSPITPLSFSSLLLVCALPCLSSCGIPLQCWFSSDECREPEQTESGAEGEPSERTVTLIVRSSSPLPELAIDEFELSALPDGSSVDVLGGGVARIEGLFGGFTSNIEAPFHVEDFVCIDTYGASDSRYTAVLTPLAPAQMIEDTGVDNLLEYGGMSLFVPADTLVDPDDPQVPVAGPVEVFMTPIPFADLPESVSCPEGIVTEGNEILEHKVNFMALADLSPRKGGKALQVIEGGGVELTFIIAPHVAQAYDDEASLYFYSLTEEGYWERVSDAELMGMDGVARMSATLTHFSSKAAGTDTAISSEEMSAQSIQATSPDGRELVVSALGPKGVSITRAGVSEGSPTIPTLGECFVLPSPGPNSWISVRSLEPRLSYWLAANAAPGLCEEVNEPILPEPAANPDGAASGTPCVEHGDCMSGVCGVGFNLEGEVTGMCGECQVDAQCPAGSCAPGTPFDPSGPRCTYGAIGDPCQGDAGCTVAGSVCSALFEIDGQPFSTCGYCEPGEPGGPCEPGSSCHAFVHTGLGAHRAWNACVPDESLPNGHVCDPLGSGEQACMGSCGGQWVHADYDMGVCGECVDDMDCGDSMCVPPPELDSVIEFFLGGAQGSYCAP